MQTPKLNEAINHLEKASAALLEVAITSKSNEPMLTLLLDPIIEVIGPLAARIQIIEEAAESKGKSAAIFSH